MKTLRSKETPRCLNKQFISFMERAALRNNTYDPWLFYRTHEDSFLSFAIYVGDGLVANKIKKLK